MNRQDQTKDRSSPEEQLQPYQRHGELQVHKAGPKEERRVAGLVNQCVALKNEVPGFDQKGQQQDEAEVPFSRQGQVPVLPGEQPAFGPVQQGQPQKQNDETDQQAGLNHPVDGKREEVVRNFLAENRVDNTGIGSENIEEKHFPVPEKGDCDQYCQPQCKRDGKGPRPGTEPVIKFGIRRKITLVRIGGVVRNRQDPRSDAQVEKKEPPENQGHQDEHGVTVKQSLPEIKFVSQLMIPPDVHELAQSVDDQQNHGDGQQG